MELMKAAQDKARLEKDLQIDGDDKSVDQEVQEDENEVQAFFTEESVKEITKKQAKDQFI